MSRSNLFQCQSKVHGASAKSILNYYVAKEMQLYSVTPIIKIKHITDDVSNAAVFLSLST